MLTTGYYRAAELDAQSLKFLLTDRFAAITEPNARNFFRFTDARGRHEISDCEPRQKGSQPLCYNLFHVGADDSLSYRTKFQRIMSGPYGIVYNDVQYFYSKEYAKQKNSLLTYLYLNDLRQIVPVVSSAMPEISKLPLSAISIVRVVRAAPGYLVASANYSSDGHLYALHVNGSKDGVWVHSGELVVAYDGKFISATSIGDDKKTREYFGLPATFPLNDYIASPSTPFGSVPLEGVIDVVNLHYDESRVVRQDSYAPDGKRSTSFLRFPQTKEDDALRGIDHIKGFADIEYTRKHE